MPKSAFLSRRSLWKERHNPNTISKYETWLIYFLTTIQLGENWYSRRTSTWMEIYTRINPNQLQGAILRLKELTMRRIVSSSKDNIYKHIDFHTNIS